MKFTDEQRENIGKYLRIKLVNLIPLSKTKQEIYEGAKELTDLSEQIIDAIERIIFAHKDDNKV